MESSIVVDENFQTPEDVCEYMVNLIPKHCRYVFEPTPGLGNIVKALRSSKRNFTIKAAKDFFDVDPKERYDCVLMNPPFSSKSADLTNAPKDINLKGMRVGYHILYECMQRSDNVIALMPWFTISDSDVRLRLLKEFGLKSVTPLPRKTFQYARIQTVIIHLEKGYKGETKFDLNYF